MMERWNPLKGHVGIISAFNFPNAVYFWNVRAFVTFVRAHPFSCDISNGLTHMRLFLL
jgi:hypothetical protein